MWPTWVHMINDFENILTWWERVKIYIKQLTIEISKSINIDKYQITKLEKRLDVIKDSEKYIHKQECKHFHKTIKGILREAN